MFMKNNIRKMIIAVIAVMLALSVQITVGAIDIGENLNWDSVLDLIGQLTAINPDNTTTTETTTKADNGEDSSNLVNNSGTGVHKPTEGETTTAIQYPTGNYNPNNNSNNNNGGNNIGNIFNTTEPSGDESTTLSFEASLSDIFEEDSANLIIQTPTEKYTIGNLVEKNDPSNDGFTWQMGALIAAAVLLVILLALIVALIIQNSKKKKKHRHYDSYPKRDESSAPVPVEIMTPERIAELLGSTSGRNFAGNTNSYETMSSDETAAAIKAAALMGQLSHSYSDPLLKRYADEPVLISPNGTAILDVDNASVADILKATDYIMDDIATDEDVEVHSVSTPSATETSATTSRICSECGNDVPVDDVFCHNCGNYIG